MKNRPKILVVGSFVMDQIVETGVFPRQGQTVLGGRFTKAPGGKGANQAVQAARLGADVTMVGKLGRDANGEEMLEACRRNGIHTEYVLYDTAEPSGCSVILLEKGADGQTLNRIIVLPGANMTITADEIAFLEDILSSFDLVMLQLEIPMEVNELVARMAYQRGVRVMLNSAPSAPLSDTLLSHLTYISPNEHEAYDLTGIQINHTGKDIELGAVRAAAAALRAKQVKNVLITLGDAGAALEGEQGFLHSPGAEGVVAVDPTAAGDSFIGAFCVGSCLGWQTEDILRFSNHTAALTVSKMGAMPSLPTLSEVKAYLHAKGLPCPDTGILEQ